MHYSIWIWLSIPVLSPSSFVVYSYIWIFVVCSFFFLLFAQNTLDFHWMECFYMHIELAVTLCFLCTLHTIFCIVDFCLLFFFHLRRSLHRLRSFVYRWNLLLFTEFNTPHEKWVLVIPSVNKRNHKWEATISNCFS